ncbi:MAG: hypothetical protein C0198_02525 [Sulfurihydrogenibium sp.]|nr:MAG: hypothetical protein C0198_02525 [Sulfurihydrogenibium sp.]
MKKYLNILAIVLLFSLKSFAKIDVEAGDLAYFYVSYKQSIKAGETQTIKIVAKDAFDNDIEDFKSTVELKYNDKVAKVQLNKGVGVFNFSETKAGNYIFQLFYNGKSYMLKDSYTKGLLKEFKVYVQNNIADKVEIATSPEFIPGYTKRLKLIAKDAYGNLVLDTSGLEQTIYVETNGLFKTTLDIKDFKNASKELEFIPLETHDIVIHVRDKNKTLGEMKLKFKKQDIGEIKLTYPEKVKAGQEFELILTVYDTDGLIIKVYDKIGKPIRLTHTGKGILYPDTIQPSDFVNGEAKVKVVYTKSEEIKIIPVIEGEKTVPARKEEFKKETVEKNLIQDKQVKEEIKESVEKITSEVSKEENTIKNKKLVKVLNLIFPSDFGKVSEIKQTSSNIYTVKLENPNKNLEFMPINREVLVSNKKIGTLHLTQEDEDTLNLKFNLDKNYTTTVTIDKENNVIKVEIYR